MTKQKPEWRLKPVKRFLVKPGNVNTPPVPADDTRAALAELVAIDDLPMALHSLPFRDQVAIAERKRLAWAAARAALARAEPIAAARPLFDPEFPGTGHVTDAEWAERKAAQPPALPDAVRELLTALDDWGCRDHRGAEESAARLQDAIDAARDALSKEPPALPEREAFEKWAHEEWAGRSIPDNAWLGWQARAALSQEPKPGCGYPYCGGNAPECATCGRASLSQERPNAAEPESRVPDEAALQRLTERGADAWAGHETERQERAAPQPEWVPVAERLPINGDWVLIYGPDRSGARFMVAAWEGHEWVSADDGYQPYTNPTHWMPLPASPVLPEAPKERE